MKLYNYLVYSFLIGAMTLTSCSEDEVDLQGVDLGKYEVSDVNLAIVTDQYGNTNVTKAELRQSGASKLYVSLTSPAESDLTFTLQWDEAVLSAYNTANATSYEALPQELVTLPESITILKGNRQSETAVVSYTSSDELATGTYALPLTLKAASGTTKVSQEKGGLVLLVNDVTKTADCSKSTGIKMVSCMDASHTNPLNMLLFTLKDSGKPFFDMVILFTSNIQMDETTGRPCIYHCPGIQTILDNYDTYLKPLQDAGMKIILSITPNHDGVGLANLSDEGCRYYARLLKNCCDAYNLDGVFFDEEYADYSDYPRSGVDFSSSRGSERVARLIYETKKAMPDKLMIAYAYSTLSSLPSVDDVQSGDFVDIALNDYMVGTDRSTHFPGMLKSEMGLYSQECALNKYAGTSELAVLRNGGYGYNMVFDLNPFNLSDGISNFADRQIPALERTCMALFDEELVYPEAANDAYKNNYYKASW